MAQSVSLSKPYSNTTTTDKHYWPEFKTAKSPDGKMMAILTMVTGKNNQLENLFAAVVNNQGEFVWSGTVSHHTERKYYVIPTSISTLLNLQMIILFIPPV